MYMYMCTNLPCNFVALCIMLQGNGEVPSVIELSEGSGLGWTLLEGPSLGRTFHLHQRKRASVDVVCGRFVYTLKTRLSTMCLSQHLRR